MKSEKIEMTGGREEPNEERIRTFGEKKKITSTSEYGKWTPAKIGDERKKKRISNARESFWKPSSAAEI